MIDPYPSEKALRRIRAWGWEDWDLMFDFIRPQWEGYGRFSKRGRTVILATGGWSGNESIIGALKSNVLFWSCCWMESKRGGYYKFQLPSKKQVKEGTV